MGQLLFHPLIAGFMLAAVLAAIMSTISSQLLVTASALVEDLYKALGRAPQADSRYVLLGRLAVLGVSLVACAMAWNKGGSILELVSFAWAGFGGAFGPTVLLSLYWRKLTATGALAGMIVGAVLVGWWGTASGGVFELHEIVPGFVGNVLVAVVVSLLTFRPKEEITVEFDESKRLAELLVAQESVPV